MAMSAEEKLKITVSLVSDVGPGERAIMESVRKLAGDASAAFAKVGEGASTMLKRVEEDTRAINMPFGRLRAVTGEIREHLHGIGEGTGIERLVEQARETREHLRGAHEGVSRLVPVFAGLGIFAGVAEFAEGMRRSVEYSEQLSLTSKATGLSAPQLGGLQYAGKIAGIDATMTNRAVEYLNRNRGIAAAGGAGSKALVKAFASIGATPQMDTAAVLGHLEDKLESLVAAHKIPRASELAGRLLGQRSGVAFLQLLDQGQKELNAQAARASYFGQAPSDKDAAAGEEFNKSLKDMDAAVGGLQLTIANKLYPVLSPIIEKMSDWIAVNRKWIATDISGEVRSFVNAVQGVDWGPIVSGVKGLGDAALWVTQHFRLVEVGLGVIAGLKLYGVTKQFVLLGAQAADTAARLILIPVAGLISSFATLVPAIGGVRDAFAAMSLAASANPLGAAIAAAALLAGAAYEVYQNWGTIRSFFKGLWSDVVADFAWAWGEIKGFVDKIESYLPHVSMPGWVKEIGHLADFEASTPAGGSALAHAAAGGLATPLRASPASVLSTPIYRARAGAAAPPAKVRIDSRVTIDHHNPPPGVTTTVRQPAPIDIDVGPAWAE